MTPEAVARWLQAEARDREAAEAVRALIAERDALREALDIGREEMRDAWHEFNAIRARDGAPPGVSPEWWDERTKRLGKALGDDRVPWMLAAARLRIERERAAGYERCREDMERAARRLGEVT